MNDQAPSVRRKYVLFTIFMIISLVLDQWTKVLARTHLRPRGPFRPKVVIEGFFDLRYAENPGVAFSMLQDIPGGRIWLTCWRSAPSCWCSTTCARRRSTTRACTWRWAWWAAARSATWSTA